MVKNVTVHGVYWGSYAMHSPRPMRRSLEDSIQWLAHGKVRLASTRGHECSAWHVRLQPFVANPCLKASMSMQVHVPVSHMLPLEQAPAAFNALLSRQAVGKVLLTLRGAAKL